jgi:PAS domain S-box-containing protein
MHAPVGIFSSTPEGRYHYVNLAMARMFGYDSPEEMIEAVSDIARQTYFDPRDRADFLEKIAANGEVVGHECRLLRRDGSLFWGSRNARAVFDSQGNILHIQGFTTDISQSRQAAAKLAHEARLSQALSEIARALTQPGTSVGEIAAVVHERALQLTDSLYGYVSSIDPVSKAAVGHTLSAMMNKDLCQVRDKQIAFPLGETGYPALFGHALNTRQAFFTNDPASHPAASGLPPGHLPLTRFLTVPAIYEGELFGQIALANAADDYTEKDIATVEALANLFATAVYRKRMEETLQHSEAKYRLLFENMTVGFALHEMIYDADGHPVDYRYLEVNPAFEKLTGVTAKQVVGRTVKEVMPAIEPQWIEVYSQVAKSGQSTSYENYAQEIGRYFRVWAFSPAPGQFAAIFSDITEQKEAEQALKASENRFKITFYTSPDAVNINRLEDGLFIEVNEGFSRLTGYSREDVLGKSTRDLDLWCSQEDRKRLVREIRENGYFENLETEIRRKDGTIVTGLLSARIFEQNGTPHLLSVTRDISSHKQLESQLAQAQKMDSVGRLAGGVAHDFNNMLGVILGYSEMALDQAKEDQTLQVALQGIRQAAQRSADLTRQLLVFARRQTIVPKVLDLNQTLTGMLNMLRRLIGEQIDLAWLPGENLAPVKIDPSQIDQILVNLCVNARDAVGDSGTVTIETDNITLDESCRANHAEMLPGEYVRLTVSDNGCGMDAKTIHHVFEPFFTTKGEGEGTGLGLATVYGIVKQNNGFINVTSTPGQGTVFTLYLPKYGRKAESHAEPVEHNSPSGTETILLVEDEPMILEMVTIMLQRQGYDVLSATTPGEALSLAEEHAGEIRLLMTDVVMPEMNGRDLANALHQRYPHLKRLFMSGYTANVIAHHGVLDEGVNFIQKPFTMKDLAAKIRDVLD